VTDGLDHHPAQLAQLAQLRESRARDPEAVTRAAAARIRRPELLGADGALLLIAADHPARGAIAAGGNPTAMGNRNDLLARLTTALARPGVDGVLGTADILEDLLLLGALDHKVVIGSMNRGGLQGSSFEFDDRFTGYDAAAIDAMGFDGGKILTRIALGDPSTVDTLVDSAHALDQLAERRLMAMIEPFMSERRDGKVHNVLTVEAVMRSVAIASGLGRTTAHRWLKLPAMPDMATVMTATTLPTLLLGGDPTDAPDVTYQLWDHALSATGVRGLIVGRALLFPPDGNVAAAVDTAAALVHDRTLDHH
jgi:hypothetical protein